MKIDILSDLHLNTYFNPNFDENSVKLIYDQIILKDKREPADVLIIAGDLGEYNSQIINFLEILKQNYYKNIICVLGNHDYYLLDYEDKQFYEFNSFTRAKRLKASINAIDGVYCLDGDIIEIDGIRFGGAMGWYDNGYIKKYFPNENIFSHINKIWESFSLDFKYILGIKDFNELYKIEYPKLQKIHKDCDVMISHINPSYSHDHIHYIYHNNQTNTFFTFDGYSLMKEGSMKYWVFGHTHNKTEYELYGVKCISNPLGYPDESDFGQAVKIKTIEI